MSTVRPTYLVTARLAPGALFALVLAIGAPTTAAETPSAPPSLPVLDGVSIDNELALPGLEGLSEDLGDYSASEEAIAAAIVDADIEAGPVEIVAIPEPSAFALLGCLGGLLLAMTLLRWHFDRATAPVAATANDLQPTR